MEWLQNNYVALVVIVLIAVTFIGWLIYLCKKNGIKKIALEAILKAEEQYNTKTGQERFEYAVDFVYNKLPDFVKAILPKEIVLNIINTDTGKKVYSVLVDKSKDKYNLDVSTLSPESNYIISINEETDGNYDTQYFQKLFTIVDF